MLNTDFIKICSDIESTLEDWKANLLSEEEFKAKMRTHARHIEWEEDNEDRNYEFEQVANYEQGELSS
jgi:hypothetical protein